MTATSPGSPLAAIGGPAPGDASTARLCATVRRLAAEEYRGRRVGSAGGRAAGAWLAGQLRDLGARVAVVEFPVPVVRELYRTPALEWTDGAQRRQLRHRRDFVEHLASADLPVSRTGPLATADAGELRGRWVLAPAVTPDITARAGTGRAAGLLVTGGVDREGWLPKLLAGRPAGPLPVLALRTDLHQRMSAVAAPGHGAATAAVPLRTAAVTGTNIHGVLREPVPGGVSVLLTAHHDGVGDDPDLRLPAASDNASGVAVVLEAARLLAPALPAGSGLAVAFLDGEEAGALGSAHHAPSVAPGTWVINVDGAGRLEQAAAIEAGGPADPLLAALDRSGRTVGVPLRGGPVASDNRRYAAAGLAAVGIGMGMAGYHGPGDTPDRVEPATLTAAARLVTATVHHLTTAIHR